MLSDTIAALATPPGRSATALIRVSGRTAFAVAGRVLEPFDPAAGRRVRRSRVFRSDSREQLDDVLYTTFRSPASFTGEDLVEISTHGGLLAPAEVLAALFAAGARLAAPGEFTRRALANGKLDLLQAEAIGDLVDASAPAQRRAALNQMDRGLSARITALRSQVLEVEALVSYDIDFPEEDEGPVPRARIDAAVADLSRALAGMLATAAEGGRLREGAICVIAGAPNAGKSSLFNALLGHERAIVTEVPGTTRDAIEAPATCGGFPFRLVDTAGLRDSQDRIERLGIEVSRRYLGAADVVLFCVETGRDLSEDERAFLGAAAAPVLLVRTKADLVRAAGEGDVAVSVLSGAGLPEVRDRLAALGFARLSATADPGPVLTRERHRIALDRARDEVERFAGARRAGLEAAVAATHLRAAAGALEDLIGLVTPDDVLDRVFSTFCVGK
jgi:tRNA modification GTPase